MPLLVPLVLPVLLVSVVPLLVPLKPPVPRDITAILHSLETYGWVRGAVGVLDKAQGAGVTVLSVTRAMSSPPQGVSRLV